MGNLAKRVLVAVVGIPLALVVIYQGGILFLSVSCIISALALYEFYKIAEKKNIHPHKIAGITLNLLLQVWFFYRNKINLDDWSLLILIIAVIFVLTLEMWSKKPNIISNISATTFGIVYISLSFCCLLGIRQFYEYMGNFYPLESLLGTGSSNPLFTLKDNIPCAWFLVCILSSIWICDTAAYFVGMKFGKHKLFPRISPKKTWEGAVAGFFGGILGFAGVAAIFIPLFPLIHSIILGGIVGIIGQLGDLAESQLKRDVGVKDSSTIIPGHGGFLDRFDSILFVMPLIYIYIVILAK